jgi:hypothetical protein
MPPGVYDFWSKVLMDPPSNEAYQGAIGEIRRTLMQRQSADSLDILYHQLGCSQHWSPLAGIWYERHVDPAANVDSFIAEIKRYCRRYGFTWRNLQAEARQK